MMPKALSANAIDMLVQDPELLHTEPAVATVEHVRRGSSPSASARVSSFSAPSACEKAAANGVASTLAAGVRSVAKELLKDTSGGGGGLFAGSAETMKERLKKKLCKKEYDVTDFYRTDGCWQAIARSPVFEKMTLSVIVVNSIWIWIDTDFNTGTSVLDMPPGFLVGENLFCLYFFSEWLIRFMAFESKWNCPRDMWMVFDSVLVFLMVMETWVMSLVLIMMSGSQTADLGNASLLRIVRLLRLVRVMRMARLLQALPELMTMVRGVMASMRSVFLAGILMVGVAYVFAICLRQLSDDTQMGHDFFPSVPEGMFVLLVDGVFLDDFGPVIRKIGRHSIVCAVVFFLFVCLSAITLMNLLIGVVCELMSSVAATEKEERNISIVKDRLSKVLNSIDRDGDGTISEQEFYEMLDNDECVGTLEGVGVDVVGLTDLVDIIFDKYRADGQATRLSVDDFFATVYGLRGSNTASVKDVVDLRRFIHQTFSRAKNGPAVNGAGPQPEGDVHAQLKALDARMEQLEASVGRVLQIVEGTWPTGVTRTKL